ncbi:hypothetical protein [Kribbella soli]|uniref:DUF2637 domain-containing protein n=1 Tax=Kribbella soli TaxID=1124743 RepID=A0A4R0HHX2_9ACTN|nr:hypothetical protein [Kribbella soli]TCC10905.1 hypothetical protein E0H45_06270 [Kribbella soli]
MTTTEMVAAGNGKATGVDKLRASAVEASQVRALSTHPDVVALRVESVRTQVDVLMWVGIVLGLAFTMVNVQDFAARNAAAWSLPWVAAWLLDPMVSLVLIAVLRAEQITARYQVPKISWWIDGTKLFAFAATFAMNTWQSWAHLDAAGIVLHSVPPVLVFCAAETAPVLRDRLTEAVLGAERAAALADPQKAAERLDGPAETTATESPEDAGKPDEQPGAAENGSDRKEPRKPRKKAAEKTGRKLLADYVTDALAALEPATAADEITPAWARHTTGCSTGLSAKVAAAVRHELTTTPQTSTNDTDAPGETAALAA